MRLFIAIQLNDEMREALTALQGDLQFIGMRGRYVPEENLHLTLAFIGEYSEPQAVLDVLSSVRFEPFDISLDGAGSFGDIWWAGIKASDQMSSLVRQLRHALSESGIPFDKKRFKPHVTLVRSARWDGHALECTYVEPVQMTVVRISLMRSERGKHRMIYTELGAILASE